jgi:hypothetical protein
VGPTTPVYAALEGVALGGISVVFEARYPGVVSQAVFLTIGTLGALFVAYRSGVIRATENKLGVVAATGGIGLLYLLSFVLGFFGVTADSFQRDIRDPVQRVRGRDRGPQSCPGLRLHRTASGTRRAEAHVELTVTYTEPGVRGDTASGGVTKLARLETGLEIRVPLFIKEGERVKVHTETREFAGRAS